jgi:TRAP-type uncharacterized transport system substrate-binding protein
LKGIKEKKVAVKIVTRPEGTRNAVMSYPVLDAYGLTKEDIKKFGGTITHTNTDVLAEDMRDGRANVWFQPATLGRPSITDVAIATPILHHRIVTRVRPGPDNGLFTNGGSQVSVHGSCQVL